jgi:hypothetical protein
MAGTVRFARFADKPHELGLHVLQTPERQTSLSAFKLAPPPFTSVPSALGAKLSKWLSRNSGMDIALLAAKMALTTLQGPSITSPAFPGRLTLL